MIHLIGSNHGYLNQVYTITGSVNGRPSYIDQNNNYGQSCKIAYPSVSLKIHKIKKNENFLQINIENNNRSLEIFLKISKFKTKIEIYKKNFEKLGTILIILKFQSLVISRKYQNLL